MGVKREGVGGAWVGGGGGGAPDRCGVSVLMPHALPEVRGC